MLPLLSLILALSPALAQDDDEFDFLDEGDEAAAARAQEALDADDFDLLDAEEDDFSDFALAVEKPPERKPAPAPQVSTEGTPLSGSLQPRVARRYADAILVEQPVFLARAGELPEGSFWLVCEVWIAGAKVAESRQWVAAATLSKAGPSIATVSLLAPVTPGQGSVEIRVGRAESAAAPATALFSQALAYSL